MKIALGFPEADVIAMDVYFYCSDKRQKSFTARATLLSDYGAARARFVTHQPINRAQARQLAMHMVPMPFAQAVAFKTPDSIKLAHPRCEEEAPVRVDILDWYGSPVCSQTQLIRPPHRRERGGLLDPIAASLLSLGARLRRPEIAI